MPDQDQFRIAIENLEDEGNPLFTKERDEEADSWTLYVDLKARNTLPQYLRAKFERSIRRYKKLATENGWDVDVEEDMDEFVQTIAFT